MIVCNEAVAVGIRKLPVTVQTALQDLKDYQADTTSRLRRCLTRSLDVASEAILADLDSEWSFLPRGIKTPRRVAASKKSRLFLPCPMKTRCAKPLLTTPAATRFLRRLPNALSYYQHKRVRAQVTIIAPGLKYSASSEILFALASSRSTCENYQGGAGNKEIRQDGVKVIYEGHNAELSHWKRQTHGTKEFSWSVSASNADFLFPPAHLRLTRDLENDYHA